MDVVVNGVVNWVMNGEVNEEENEVARGGNGVIEVARWMRVAIETMEDWSRRMMKRGEMDHGGKLGMKRGEIAPGEERRTNLGT